MHRKRVANPHEFARLVTSRALCKSAIAPPKSSRYSITDIWDTNGKRRTSVLRSFEENASLRPRHAGAKLNATQQLNTLGGCLVHPIIELDFVAAPDLHRYPHLRKFCSMVDFDLLSPQRVVAFWTTVRLFPQQWQQIFGYKLRARSFMGAVRYNELFEWPSSSELLEIAEAYREYFRPSPQASEAFASKYSKLLESTQSLVHNMFLAESKNDSFRLALFFGAVLRPCVSADTSALDKLFGFIGETRLSTRRSNVALLAKLKALDAGFSAEEVAAFVAEFRLPKRKYDLLYPKRPAK